MHGPAAQKNSISAVLNINDKLECQSVAVDVDMCIKYYLSIHTKRCIDLN